jgi:hypothetical protein
MKSIVMEEDHPGSLSIVDRVGLFRYLRGRNLHKLGRHEEASEEFDRVIKQQKQVGARLVWLMCGCVGCVCVCVCVCVCMCVYT